jgi:hypothetical protein
VDELELVHDLAGGIERVDARRSDRVREVVEGACDRTPPVQDLAERRRVHDVGPLRRGARQRTVSARRVHEVDDVEVVGERLRPVLVRMGLGVAGDVALLVPRAAGIPVVRRQRGLVVDALVAEQGAERIEPSLVPTSRGQ